jgi:uncharacterized protein YfaT (DUF1175 family)
MVNKARFLCIVCLMCLFFSCSQENEKRLNSSAMRYSDGREDRFRHTVITLARELIGTRYLRAGKTPKGFDCSGLVIYVLKEMNVPMAASSQEQARCGKSIAVQKAKPGDLIFFSHKKTVSHVGIITEISKDKLKVVHSSSSRGVIEEDVLKSDYWVRRISQVNDLHSYSKVQIRSYSGR